MSTALYVSARTAGSRLGAAGVLLLGAALMNAGLLLAGPARAAIELPLAMVLPGAGVIAAARGSRPARPASDIGLAIVLSFAVWISVALACFVLRQRLTTAAFVVGGDLVMLASIATCVVRAAPLSTLVGAASTRDQRLRFALFALAAAGCGGTVALGAYAAPTPAPYSQIALAGPWAHVASAVAVQPGRPVAVDVVVSNHTAATRTYVVAPVMQGAAWKARNVALDPGESRHVELRGRVPRGGCLHRLSVVLHDPPTGSVVGSLTLWLQNGKRLPAGCTP
jgi:hypothetical protein